MASVSSRNRHERAFDWSKLGEYGLISGVAVLFFCLVGMVETFHERDVIDGALSLGRSLLVVVSLGMGYVAANKLSDGNSGKAIIAGVGAGLIGGIIGAILIVIAEPIGLRNMFVNASPALINILTFKEEGLSQSSGTLVFIGVFTILSLIGAIIHLLPNLLRRTLTAGLSAVILIGMLTELLDVILKRSDVTEPVADFLFGSNGLSAIGAITVFAIFALLNGLWTTQNQVVKSGIAKLPEEQQKTLNWAGITIGIILLILLPQLVGPYISQILVLVGLFILMGLGLNIEIGLAGLLDLGFVGFYAIGAYTVALLTSTAELGLSSVVAGDVTGVSYTSFWVAIPVAVIISALAGVLLGIPVLRMRGDYLAIVTLGFAEIIRILVLSDFLRPVLGGAQGILNIPKPSAAYLFSISERLPDWSWLQSLLSFFMSSDALIKTPGNFYYIIVIGCVIIAFIAWRLQYARVGRSWMAMREDEDVAEAMGINLIASKLLAFGIGAAFAGLAGAIFAAQIGSVFPHSFALLVSINVVSLVIIGGVGSIPGVIIGALVLVGLPELLREFAEFRLLIYGALLVVMMLVKPEGFWPSEVQKRELVEEEEVVIEVEPVSAGQAV